VDGGAISEASYVAAPSRFRIVERGYAAPPPGWRR